MILAVNRMFGQASPPERKQNNMAMNSTIYRVAYSINQMDKSYFETFDLRVARHPSENEDRMMARLVAFGLWAEEGLTFTKGLCSDKEPEIWSHNYDGSIRCWIELGEPDVKRLTRACKHAEHVHVLVYGENSVDGWWTKVKPLLHRFKNLEIVRLDPACLEVLERQCTRRMDLSLFVSDGDATLNVGEEAIPLPLTTFDLWEA